MKSIVITPKELRIINVFRKNVLASHTILELSRLVGTGSYSWTHATVTKLVSLGILETDRKGQSTLCRINLKSPLSIKYLALLDFEDAMRAEPPNTDALLGLIKRPYFTLAVTGSYASGKQTKNSDMDVMIIIDSSADTRPLLNRLKSKGELMVPELHPFVFTEDEFMKMLLSEDENYGKQAFRNRLIIFGGENYYRMIEEAIRRGFKG